MLDYEELTMEYGEFTDEELVEEYKKHKDQFGDFDSDLDDSEYIRRAAIKYAMEQRDLS